MDGFANATTMRSSAQGSDTMIRDITIDQTLIELARTMKALKALRVARRNIEHAAAIRASMDLTRKLADLRQGR
jgi:hypothetical protein